MGETAGKHRVQRVVDVDDVRTPAARLPAAGRAHEIGEARGLVDRDVVNRGDLFVEGRGLPLAGLRHVPELSEVENLHSVLPRPVGDDEHVVAEHLHVPPGVGAAAPGLGEVAEITRVERVGDVDEGRPVHAADEGVFAPGLRVGPAPHVVESRPASRAEFFAGEEGEEIYAVAVEPLRESLLAVDLAARDRGEPNLLAHQPHDCAGFGVPDDGGPGPEVVRGQTRHHPTAARGHDAPRRGRFAARHLPPVVDRPTVLRALKAVHEALTVGGQGCANPHDITIYGERGTERGGGRVAWPYRAGELPLPGVVHREAVNRPKPFVLPGRPDQCLTVRKRYRRPESPPGFSIIGTELCHLIPSRALVEAEQVCRAAALVRERRADEREIPFHREGRPEPRGPATRRETGLFHPFASGPPVGDDDILSAGGVRGRDEEVFAPGGERAPELFQARRGNLARVQPFGSALEHVHGTRPRRAHEQPGVGGRERDAEAVPHDGLGCVQRLDFRPASGAIDAHAAGLAFGRGLSHQHLVLGRQHGRAEPLCGERGGSGRPGQGGQQGEDGGRGGERSDSHECDHDYGPPVSSDPAYAVNRSLM